MVHAETDGRPLLAVLPGQQYLSPGEEIALACDAKDLHPFDAEGLRVG